MQQQAFLDAIAAEPEQDVHRLVFADWLQEQGQEQRGEFIRWQCQLEQLAPEDDRAREARRRMDDLLVEHEREWLGEWADLLVRWQFRRGFLHEATLQPEVFLRSGARLLREHPIHQLAFVDDQGDPAPPEVVEEIVRSPALAGVRALDLSCGSEPSPWSNPRGSRANLAWARALAQAEHIECLGELIFADSAGPGFLLGKEELRLLAGAEHLRTLQRLDLGDGWSKPSIDAEAIGILSRAAFAGNLRHLDLRDCPIGDEGVARLADDEVFSSLQGLGLLGCATTGRGVRAIMESPALANLLEVQMDFEEDLSALAGSGRLARLRSLVLYPHCPGESLDDHHTPDWLEIAHLVFPALQSLTLDSCSITAPALQALLTAPGLGGLRELRCRCLSLGAEMDWGVLTKGQWPRLAVLDLAGSGCRRDLDWLVGWPAPARLRELDLSGCPVLSQHLPMLLESPYFGASLETLGLVSCALEEKDIVLLAGCPGLARLKTLRLNWQNLTVAAITALATSPWLQRLETLHIAGSVLQRVEAAGLAQEGRLPRLHELAVREAERGTSVEALRRRFGPRLRLFCP